MYPSRVDGFSQASEAESQKIQGTSGTSKRMVDIDGWDLCDGDGKRWKQEGADRQGELHTY